MKKVLLIPLVACSLIAPRPASAFDSKCSLPDGSFCEGGPQVARNRWDTPDSEHMQIWERIVANMGLPAHLTKQAVSLTVATGDKTVEQVKTLQPYPFAKTERLATREYKISEMTQLPDLSYSLWDWVLGNEYCPLGPGPTVRDCHSFATHMGAVNSSHFLPQAKHFYHYYHDLAVYRAANCKELRNKLGNQFPAFVEQCDQQALTYEAIGHHYLQDAWSMGHMWPRWGGPHPRDFGQTEWRERAVLIALTAGMIHGARGLLQPVAQQNWPQDSDGIKYGKPDVLDAMCAPIDPVSYACDTDDHVICVAPDFWKQVGAPAYVDGSDGQEHRGIGDLYADELASESQYSAAWKRLWGCAQSSVLDVVTMAGLTARSDDASFAKPSEPVFDELCFDQRATNVSLWLGAGVDLIIHDVEVGNNKVKVPIAGQVKLPGAKRTIYLHVSFTPLVAAKSLPKVVKDLIFGDVKPEEASAAEGVIWSAESKTGVKLTEEMKAQFRRDVAGLAAFLETAARARPHATNAAENLPPLLGIKANDEQSFQHDPPAAYLDPQMPYQPSFSLEPGITTDEYKADAVARAYNKSFAGDWCEVTTVADLESLKTSKPGPLCDVCGDIAGRHLRLGKDASHYDQNRPPLCERLGGKAFVYLDENPTGNETWDELGQRWCGCAASTSTCTGGCAGRVVDKATGKAIADAQIDYITEQGSNTIASDGSGNFRADSLQCGQYHLRIQAEGYIAAELDVDIDETAGVVQLVSLRAIADDCAGVQTRVSGRVIDGFSGNPVHGATVQLQAGPSAPRSAAVLASAETDDSGAYTIDGVESGYYTTTVSAPGYESSGAAEVSACGQEPQRDIHLIPEGEPGVSFVLNWARPDDLDLHLLLPSGDEVAFGECAGGLQKEPFALFEVDHTLADGPESVRIGRFMPGVYTLYVHNYSAQNAQGGGFADSEAEVVVYESSQPVRVLHVPTAGSGYFWDVLEIEGTDDGYQLRPLGRLTDGRANPKQEGAYSAVCTPAP